MFQASSFISHIPTFIVKSTYYAVSRIRRQKKRDAAWERIYAHIVVAKPLAHLETVGALRKTGVETLMSLLLLFAQGICSGYCFASGLCRGAHCTCLPFPSPAQRMLFAMKLETARRHTPSRVFTHMRPLMFIIIREPERSIMHRKNNNLVVVVRGRLIIGRECEVVIDCE